MQLHHNQCSSYLSPGVNTKQYRDNPSESYTSAEVLAQQNPQYSTQIIAAAKSSFLAGDQWAYIAGIVAILVGAAILFFKFPKKITRGIIACGVPEN